MCNDKLGTGPTSQSGHRVSPTVTSVGSGPNTLSLILQGACGPDLAKMLKPVPSFEHGSSPTELVGLNGIGKGRG